MRTLAALAVALAAAVVWIGSAGPAVAADEEVQGAVSADSFVVDPLDRVMKLTEAANVRSGPGTDYAVRVVLNAGATVRVTGVVQDRNWLRVDLHRDGEAAFVHASLLQEANPPPLKPSGRSWSLIENQPCQVWNHGRGDKYEGFTWSGACVDGKAAGQGRLVWHSRYGMSVYEGGMEAGKQHGNGTLRRSDGGRYEGDWHDGMRQGRGTYTWAVGHRYRGDWRDDKPHGFGVATFADGDVFKGLWLRGCYQSRDGRGAALITTLDACAYE